MCGTNLDDMVNRLILFLCALKGVTHPKCCLKATEDVAGSDGSWVPPWIRPGPVDVSFGIGRRQRTLDTVGEGVGRREFAQGANHLTLRDPGSIRSSHQCRTSRYSG